MSRVCACTFRETFLLYGTSCLCMLDSGHVTLSMLSCDTHMISTGRYQQQDAHECWSAIVTSLSQTLTVSGSSPSPEAEVRM